MSVLLDHLVVVAASLQQGVDWCEATLGVTPGPGGQHPLMSTHNRMLKIASAAFPLAYLEIIAIDPAAPAPGRARWFGLDEPALQARVQRSPQLVHLVARSAQLDMHRYGLIHADMRLANLLVEGDQVTLIDFDDCGFCWFMYDFAAAISFHEDHPLVPVWRQNWLEGYQSVRALQPTDITALDTMILLRRMALLAWIGSHAETILARSHADHA